MMRRDDELVSCLQGLEGEKRKKEKEESVDGYLVGD
jgi:hypothetical protein